MAEGITNSFKLRDLIYGLPRIEHPSKTYQVNVHAHVVDGGPEEVGRRAVELFVLLASLTPSQVLVARHCYVDV
jgi:hypothetical protein